jgi:hypothetical protein
MLEQRWECDRIPLLYEGNFDVMTRPPGRMSGSRARRTTTTFVVTLIVVSLLPSIPVELSSGGDEPTICGCGCGNPKGQCCCSAPRASGLSFSCSQREDPNEPVDVVSSNKIIGPPGAVELVLPMPATADLNDLELEFSGLDPRPEIPPPRA